MLVLSRKKDEVLVIHRKGVVIAELIIVEVRENRVRVGTDAPSDVEVDRKEVFIVKYPGGKH